MFGTAANPIASYKTVENDAAVASADPHRLVQLLFDGASQGIATARAHMVNGNIAERGRIISQVLDIINNGLRGSLDTKASGELAQNLDSLYAYMAARLVLANLRNEVAILDEVQGLVNEIGSAWRQIAPRNQTL